jgi:PcrA/UvrD tudor domain
MQQHDHPAEASTLAAGDLIEHDRWGIGLVLTVEGIGHLTQAHIAFNDTNAWIILADASMSIVHKREDRPNGTHN